MLRLVLLLPGEGAFTLAVEIAELDGDGWPDVAVSRPSVSRFDVLRSDGAGGLLPARTLAADHTTGDLAVADLDADLQPEVVATSGTLIFGDGGVSVHRNIVASFAWSVAGEGLAGSLGVPQLAGTGALLPGTPGDLRLFHARPLAAAALFISATSAPAAFRGGRSWPCRRSRCCSCSTTAPAR